MIIKYDISTGLVPAIVQDTSTKNVLMLGYMNQEAYEKTLASGKVTFFSRSKQRLWTKGEESGHFLELVDLKNDCIWLRMLLFGTFLNRLYLLVNQMDYS